MATVRKSYSECSLQEKARLLKDSIQFFQKRITTSTDTFSLEKTKRFIKNSSKGIATAVVVGKVLPAISKESKQDSLFTPALAVVSGLAVYGIYTVLGMTSDRKKFACKEAQTILVPSKVSNVLESTRISLKNNVGDTIRLLTTQLEIVNSTIKEEAATEEKRQQKEVAKRKMLQQKALGSGSLSIAAAAATYLVSSSKPFRR